MRTGCLLGKADMATCSFFLVEINYGQPTADYVDADPYCKALPLELVNDLIPLVESRYRTYLSTTDAEGIAASRGHRAIGGFSMGGVTIWYALDEVFSAFKYYLPISGDCWSLGAFAGMNRPAQTAEYFAKIIRQSPYVSSFYIWAASGTSDSAYSETLYQVRGMVQLTDIFGIDHLSFHEKDGARHEYRPLPEYVYNALPFFFPRNDANGISDVQAQKMSKMAIHYDLSGIKANGHGVTIVNGLKYLKK